MAYIEQQICKYTDKTKPVYFTGIKYLVPQKLYGEQNFSENVLLFTGIANPAPLKEFVKKNYNLLGHRKFPDHYSFTKKDMSDLIQSFLEINSDTKCLLTTEKDMVRLISMKDDAKLLEDYPIFYLPIELYFLDNGDFFANELENKVEMGLRELEDNR